MARKHAAWTAIAAAVGTVLAVLAGVVGLAGTAWSHERGATPRSGEATPAATDTTTSPELGIAPIATPVKYRNVVMVLGDDMDWALFDEVPRLAALKAEGTTFLNHTVTDSLCCPSRTSIIRSQYVHNHQVVSNSAASGGGWPTFSALGLQHDCLPTWLDTASVTSGLYGKYINEFPDGEASPKYVPPGWDDFIVAISGKKSYTGYNYVLNENGKLKKYGDGPDDYLNDVLDANVEDFIKTTDGPFFVMMSSFNPHMPAPAAKRNKGSHPEAMVPRTPAYNAAGAATASWRAGSAALPDKRLAKLDEKWQQRLESAESIADSVDSIRAALSATGQLDDTLIIVTSDNGFHMASRQMPIGKRTPYLEDTVVPLVFIGPGVPAGRTVSEMTSTVDLGPTIAGVLDAPVPEWVDGRSLQPFLNGGTPETWRTAMLSESMGKIVPGDVDWQPYMPPPFAALRTPRWLYVEYAGGDVELFDRTSDPWELTNIAPTADFTTLSRLHEQLEAMRACSGETCRVADSMPNGGGLAQGSVEIGQ